MTEVLAAAAAPDCPKFHWDQLQAERFGRLGADKTGEWKWLIWALYGCLLAITIRILYCLAEFSAGLGASNPLPSAVHHLCNETPHDVSAASLRFHFYNLNRVLLHGIWAEPLVPIVMSCLRHDNLVGGIPADISSQGFLAIPQSILDLRLIGRPFGADPFKILFREVCRYLVCRRAVE
ncbi:hypothetical protein CC86DRAFT_434843 [Ophiobolus disseminans]|uniref:Uncharacterized protein n=1 Tax=Ophiobolus disseminans TaxID=1469910 RepID=A0A6A7ADF7_9PLEO|nr:hypothetical protein CC86DRAFT_434843 [Ophiobolus disseminans]